jgi:hypothetical protein
MTIDSLPFVQNAMAVLIQPIQAIAHFIPIYG